MERRLTARWNSAQELASHPEFFVETLTERLLMYSVNRPLEYFDMPQVRKIVRDAKKDNYTFTSLVLGIVNTDAFRKQGLPGGRLSKPAPAVTASAAIQRRNCPPHLRSKPRQQRSSRQSRDYQETNMFNTKKHLSRRTDSEGRRCQPGPCRS